jgi:hypothetical protein
MFSIVQADYEFMKDSRLLLFQRMTSNLGAAAGLPGGKFRFLDPRVGWRQTNVISNPDFLGSTIDFYAQLPLSSQSQQQQRALDLGVQGNFSYLVPKSKLTLGVVTDVRGSFYQAALGNNNFQGFFAPWASYELSRKFSTQHWFNLPWRHKQEDAWDSIGWAFPGRPYIQNGIGLSANKFLWFSLMINNYVDTAPTLQNTWASLWVSVTAL